MVEVKTSLGDQKGLSMATGNYHSQWQNQKILFKGPSYIILKSSILWLLLEMTMVQG